MEFPEDAEYILGEYLSELYGLLQVDGYTLKIDKLIWKPAKIKVCLDYIGRITDNCVGIAEEAMAEVSFITLNEEELKRMDFAPKTEAVAK